MTLSIVVMSYNAIDVLQQDTAVDALVAINKRVNDAVAELWLDSQNRTTSSALELLTIQSSDPNHNSAAAPWTLLLLSTNASAAAACCSTSIAFYLITTIDNVIFKIHSFFDSLLLWLYTKLCDYVQDIIFDAFINDDDLFISYPDVLSVLFTFYC